MSLVNLHAYGRIGQYFAQPSAQTLEHITWLKGYGGFTVKVGQVFSEAGEELRPEDKINLNTRVLLFPTTEFKVKLGTADLVPTDAILSFGTPIYRWRIAPGEVVRMILRVNKPLKVSDLLGEPLVDCYIMD